MRPGKPVDLLPSPFPNEEAAKAQFFGLYPPDLTYIIFARRNGRNLIFSLLTGWMDPPAGVSLTDYQHFNIYFPGNVTVMPQVTKSRQPRTNRATSPKLAEASPPASI